MQRDDLIERTIRQLRAGVKTCHLTLE